jgi:type IV secretion system protein VirD4
MGRSTGPSNGGFACLIGLGVLTLLLGADLYLALSASVLLQHGHHALRGAPPPSKAISLLVDGLIRHELQPWIGYPGLAPHNYPTPTLFWTLAVSFGVLATAALVALSLLLITLLGSRSARLTTHGESRWAARSEARKLGRTARPDHLYGDGIVLGWMGSRVLQTPREDNALVFGVQRAGKTSSVVVPTLLGWRGSVVATSTKDELVKLTGAHRARFGPVYVFAPLEDDATWIHDLGLIPAVWNPVTVATSAGIAAEIADLFTEAGKNSPSAHWYLSAANLITGLILAERAAGGDLRSVVRTLNTTAHSEYVDLASRQEIPEARELLQAFALTPDREAGSIASTARAALGLWLDPRVASATSSQPSPRYRRLELSSFLQEGATLFLVAPAEEAQRCRPLFSALIQTLLRTATARARAQGGVLRPRLLQALDEIANFARIPRLVSYVSSGPGQGIHSLLCFHDMAQVEAAYGPEAARTIWNNCRARVLLPGQGDLRTLRLFSESMGNETVAYEAPAWNAEGRRSLAEHRVAHPLASVDVLRRMGRPIAIYADSPPAQLTLRRWDQVDAWRRLVMPPSLPAAAATSPKPWQPELLRPSPDPDTTGSAALDRAA